MKLLLSLSSLLYSLNKIANFIFLIIFSLTRPDNLEELVNLITEEPSLDLEDRYRYKYSNVACELLTCDVPILTEKLAGNFLFSILSLTVTFETYFSYIMSRK